MKKSNLKFFIGLTLLAGLASCKRDDDLVDVPPPITNGAEVITTLQLHFTEVGMPTNTFTYEYSDIDGVGGNPPIADTISLEINKTYTVTIDVLNESESPADTLTGEIDDVISGDLMVDRTDLDNNNLEVGLASDWTVGPTAGSGHMDITLKHQPEIKDGSCTPGETDIEAHFEIKLQ